ncbi:MAG: dUTP diphosphatase [Candidatus Liptonbacteria bacterium]
MRINITRVDPTLPLPEYKTAGAVAFDLYTREDAEIPPHKYALLPSNLIIEVPAGHVLLVAARSSLPQKGLTPPHGIGIVDQDYHGPEDEVKILVYNVTEEPVKVARGERIAQGLIVPIVKAEWNEEKSANGKSRGGFGSTG